MQFYADALGPKQAVLPSGSLLCLGVPIARTGEQEYLPYEIGIDADDAGDDGTVTVQRDAAEVFNPRSMASFEGVAVVMRHPAGAVDPSNWRDIAIGHAQNVRRDGDLLLADLLIHDRRAIDAIRFRGWKGVSCGYEAAYEPIGPGRMRQRDVVGNHIAILAPGEAPRCGEACMIGDAAPRRKEKTMGSILQMTDAELDAALARAFPKRKRPARDQEGTSDIPTTWSASRGDPNDGRRVEGGERPGSKSGAELVMLLPGNELTSWFIGKSDAGEVALYRHVSTPPIRGVSTTADTMALMRRREATDQAASRSAASQVREFWKRQANG